MCGERNDSGDAVLASVVLLPNFGDLLSVVLIKQLQLNNLLELGLGNSDVLASLFDSLLLLFLRG
jgi:hypothetical protein